MLKNEISLLLVHCFKNIIKKKGWGETSTVKNDIPYTNLFGQHLLLVIWHISPQKQFALMAGEPDSQNNKVSCNFAVSDAWNSH